MGNTKYMQLAASSAFKGRSDRGKYEKARELNRRIDSIRKHYETRLTYVLPGAVRPSRGSLANRGDLVICAADSCIGSPFLTCATC